MPIWKTRKQWNALGRTHGARNQPPMCPNQPEYMEGYTRGQTQRLQVTQSMDNRPWIHLTSKV